MPKDVYLIIDGYEKIFKLFVGEDKGDFSPRVSRLNELKIGDEVEIYFEENVETRTEHVNRLLHYLDKNGDLYYLRGNAEKYVGWGILGFSGVLFITGIYMKLKLNSKQ
jgi:hypothetical protein